MREITGNLRRDMKDLLGESAHIVTGFFKRGVCTVRAVADKWRTFTQDISAAVDELMKPPFLEGGPDAPLSTMEEGAEPIVTVTGIIDRNFPIGKQMPLSLAVSYTHLENIVVSHVFRAFYIFLYHTILEKLNLPLPASPDFPHINRICYYIADCRVRP